MSHVVRFQWWSLLVLGACSGPGNVAHPVRPGIEVLISDSLHLLRGLRVGLLTNQTGVGREGSSDIELLLGAGVDLTALFSPEHGFRGVLDQSAIGHSADSATGLPVFSLYGETRSPTPEMLERIDVLAIDIQDIGSRTYTYISTTFLAMRAAADVGKAVVVLDRPNPIGGVMVQGPRMSAEDTSFVGMLRIPLRHGMTSGELALYGNRELSIDVALTVVPADGWRRSQWFDETDLPWVRPSPSMPSLESATHYPGFVLFEATNLSVGRGTPIAFQMVGAPWLDPARVARLLVGHPGVSIRDTVATPERPPDGKFDGQALPTLRFLVTDREAYDPIEVATDVLAAIYAIHGDSLAVLEPRLRRLSGSGLVGRLLGASDEMRSAWRDWEADAARFAAERAPFLLYR